MASCEESFGESGRSKAGGVGVGVDFEGRGVGADRPPACGFTFLVDVRSTFPALSPQAVQKSSSTICPQRMRRNIASG